jgi:predicted Co/Zn/Cd cation transporter (cation efflux family)
MTLAYVIAAFIAVVAFLAMGGSDVRLRIGVAVGIFICIAALATWVVMRVGDEAPPGSVEVKSISPGQDPPASGSR